MTTMGGVRSGRFLLVYASEKGTAKAIAEDLAEQCNTKGLTCELRCASEVDKGFTLENETTMVLIGSTTGDGDPPETARKFWRKVHKKDQSTDHLKHLSYTVLGLGDTNYTDFCNFGKTIDKKLQMLGAERFYPCGWADDGTGLEIVIEPWIEALIPSLQKHLTSCSASYIDKDDISLECQKNSIDREAVCNGSNIEKNGVVESNKSVENIFESNPVNEREAISDVVLKYKLDAYSEDELNQLPIKCCSFSSDAKLTLPVCPAPYLLITYKDASDTVTLEEKNQNGAPFPSAASEVMHVHVASIKELTTQNAVKTALAVDLELSDYDQLNFEPGDSFGVIVRNNRPEVDLMLVLLRLQDVADKYYELTVDPNSKRKTGAVPNYIPLMGTIRNILESCLDIRSVPKKTFLRALVEHTSDVSEKRRLQELVSKEGTTEYSKYIRNGTLGLIDLLNIFRTCKPPITTIIEHLPRLLPRAYSICSSPLVSKTKVTFAFNVVDIPKSDAFTFSRQGICTGWFSKHISEDSDLNLKMEKLSIEKKYIQVGMYLRTNQKFRLPHNISVPIIMVGPGTGVAPFVGFIEQREALNESSENIIPGESWLFYGCRHKERDFLFREKLEKFVERKALNNLCVCYSRDEQAEGSPRYVQDNINKHGDELSVLIMDKEAVVYVCGDAKNMAKSVFDSFVNILIKHKELSELDARKYMAQLQIDNRYLQDVWA
ncbi:unnamed protein product [Meganyctiphanes norvegica]|uniref:Methionine synthase reductase n=1 Tax=Meganyctiphanes norvegica TaxID=48144 RepID=A0AAV2S713_MEGNR